MGSKWPDGSKTTSPHSRTPTDRLENSKDGHISTLETQVEGYKQRSLGLENDLQKLREEKENELNQLKSTLKHREVSLAKHKEKLNRAHESTRRAHRGADWGSAINATCMFFGALAAGWALSDDHWEPARLTWLIVALMFLVVGLILPIIFAKLR